MQVNIYCSSINFFFVFLKPIIFPTSQPPLIGDGIHRILFLFFKKNNKNPLQMLGSPFFCHFYLLTINNPTFYQYTRIINNNEDA